MTLSHVSTNIYLAYVCFFLLGLTSEGIYRKSGVNSRVAALCERFRRDARSVRLREGEQQVDDVSNTLKRFFRDLEEGLFTSEDSSSWLSTAGQFLLYTHTFIQLCPFDGFWKYSCHSNSVELS